MSYQSGRPRAERFPESSRVVPRCVRAWGLSHGSIPCDAEVVGAAWKDGKTVEVEVEDWDWTRRGLSTPVIAAAAAAASYHCNSSRHVTLLSQRHRETRLHYTVPQKSGRTTVHHHHHHHQCWFQFLLIGLFSAYHSTLITDSSGVGFLQVLP